MNAITPEQAGISSRQIEEYIRMLEENRLSTHNLLLAKGDQIFFEAYWPPFHQGLPHRLYSVSKSIVSLAVGFACQDGLLSLSDPMEKHFPEELRDQTDACVKAQTVRDMLMMSTARVAQNWFDARCADRVKLYFEDIPGVPSRPSGTVFQYDSSGSFVLCALVERVTGLSLLDYMRAKLFDQIGISRSVDCLSCPGGHSWGDSGILMSASDLLKVARFVMNEGRWQGKQLLDASYIRAAVQKQIDNNVRGLAHCEAQGYGYQIWRTYDHSYFFNGMGCQFAVCVPDQDLIMVYNGDNQGKDYATALVIDSFFRLIARPCAGSALPADPQAQESLARLTATLSLAAAAGDPHSAFEAQIDGVTYQASPNPMGIQTFSLTFHEDGGVFSYTNAQGDKALPFGRCQNVFGPFPQTGYSDRVGSQEAPGHTYQCAASAAWVEPQKLFIKVQIIDAYLGNLNITLGFKGDVCGLYMNKAAEDFLCEYEGFAGAKAVR